MTSHLKHTHTHTHTPKNKHTQNKQQQTNPKQKNHTNINNSNKTRKEVESNKQKRTKLVDVLCGCVYKCVLIYCSISYRDSASLPTQLNSIKCTQRPLYITQQHEKPRVYYRVVVLPIQLQGLQLFSSAYPPEKAGAPSRKCLTSSMFLQF